MSDIKVQLPKFDGKPSSDYGLWLYRLEAILEAKGLAHMIQHSEERAVAVPAESASTDVVDAALQVRKASSIIVNGLADKPQRIVRAHCKCPLKMIQKLNERYASSTLSTRLSPMWQLNGLSYQRGKDKEDFADSFASIVDRLECMGANFDEDLSMVMLLNSMNGTFEFTVEEMMTLGDEKLTWDDVCSRLIEVSKTSQNKRRDVALTGREMITCEFCDKREHEAGRRWKNPDNLYNRLDSSSDAEPSRINKHKKNAAKVVKASKPAARASKANKARNRPDSSSNESSSSDEDPDARRFHLNNTNAVSSALRAHAAQQSSCIILEFNFDSGASTQYVSTLYMAQGSAFAQTHRYSAWRRIHYRVTQGRKDSFLNGI
jgi:gag-polypeptide of LTR copia-type